MESKSSAGGEVGEPSVRIHNLSSISFVLIFRIRCVHIFSSQMHKTKQNPPKKYRHIGPVIMLH